MNSSVRTTGLKFLYGFGFTVVLPVLLIVWAKATESSVTLPAVDSTPLGVILAGLGAIFLVSGMLTLMIHGRGLPMNMFPPEVYVRNGIYRFIPHPIYTGFSFLCFGVAVLLQSRSGFWLVAPAAALGCIALVEGYERQDLAERFGDRLRRCLVTLPEDSERKPYLRERISVVLLVFIPWAMMYEAFVVIGNPPDAMAAYLPFEYRLPVLEWTEIFYAATYGFVLLVPFAAGSARILRDFSVAGLIAVLAMLLFFIGIPLVAPPRGFTPQGIAGTLLLFERAHDTSAAAFPSYHTVWAVIAAHALGRSFPRLKPAWWLLALLIAASCVTTGMHAFADVAAGIVAGLVIVRYRDVWEWLRRMTERAANSWKEWHLGNVRIINHGGYTALGAAAGVLIAMRILGPGSELIVLVAGFSSLILAGLWAQVIEGSPRLLRPFGYYGGVIGIAAGGILAEMMGGNFWQVLGAFAVAGPVIQAFGRVRCLVQGCCHGRATAAFIGIRYTHPRSRVVRLAGLAGVPVHPTPLYSVLWNFVTAILLARLWSLDASPTMIAGCYLILNGLGRFVEEAYRGEPQTPILGKLRLYQLMSILSVLAGGIVTAISSEWKSGGSGGMFTAVVLSAGFGAVVWFAQGVDFPESNRRFARLV